MFNNYYMYVFKSLIDKIDVNEKDTAGMTVLHRAIICEYPPEYIKLILNKGSDINATDTSGLTPLQILLDKNGSLNQTKLVILLLDRGANFSEADYRKNTILEECVKIRNRNLFKNLWFKLFG